MLTHPTLHEELGDPSRRCLRSPGLDAASGLLERLPRLHRLALGLEKHATPPPAARREGAPTGSIESAALPDTKHRELFTKALALKNGRAGGL